MRAKEFILESNSVVKIKQRLPKNAESAMTGAHRVAGTPDRTYDLNRIMMLLAGTDGKNHTHASPQSWAGKNNTAHPYTVEELKMLKHVYALANIEWDDVIAQNSSNKSTELDDTNKRSPVNSFKGY